MILVEIATRCDLISVSMAALRADVKLLPPFYVGVVTGGPPQQEQAEGMRMDIMWRPPLPEVKAGKADTDCPNQGHYSEVSIVINDKPIGKSFSSG